MPGDTHKRYPPELWERAVRMVAEIQAEHESEWAAMTRVAELLLSLWTPRGGSVRLDGVVWMVQVSWLVPRRVMPPRWPCALS